VDVAELFLLAVTGLCFYCTGASWMLQVVCYPTYELVGEREFVPFHVSFGQRLMAVAVGPMVLTSLATFVLLFFRPATAPLWAAVVVALCTATVLVTTIVLEVPKHNALDRDGKSSALIDGLVRDNLPRVAAWTIASLLLAYMASQTL
jgi:MFS superfamily sulfate permease-like transporter